MKYTYTFTLTVGDKSTKYKRTFRAETRAKADDLFNKWMLGKCEVKVEYESDVVEDMFKMFRGK